MCVVSRSSATLHTLATGAGLVRRVRESSYNKVASASTNATPSTQKKNACNFRRHLIYQGVRGFRATVVLWDERTGCR